MRIKNESIKIKNGNKETTLNNYIYDEYLELFSKTQYSISDLDQQQKKFNECYLRFDEPLVDIRNADTNDFEVMIRFPKINLLADNKSANVTYRYMTNEYVYDITGARERLTEINRYIGKKITAIGFGVSGIMACLDVSNYEIYVTPDEGLEIVRKDTISTEGICYNYDFPVHLSPVGDINNPIYTGTNNPKYAVLYSVGFAKTEGIEELEYVIGEDINVNIIDDTKFGFSLEKSTVDMIYPSSDTYPSSDIYPNNQYNYVFFKYRLYYFNSSTLTYLDEYYTMFIKNNTNGSFEFIDKIERSE